MDRLKEKADSLEDNDKNSLLAKIEAIEKESEKSKSNIGKMLNVLADEENIDMSEFSFSLPFKSLELIKAIIKGTKTLQIAITDMHCIVITHNATGVFTLSSTIPIVYNSIGRLTQVTPIAEVVVDTQAILKDLSFISLSANASNNNIPLLMTIKDGCLKMSLKETATRTDCISSTGELNKVSMYLDTAVLRKIVSKMDAGNLCISFQNTPSDIVILRNGTLTEKSDSLSLLLTKSYNEVEDDVEEDVSENE